MEIYHRFWGALGKIACDQLWTVRQPFWERESRFVYMSRWSRLYLALEVTWLLWLKGLGATQNPLGPWTMATLYQNVP